MIIASLVVAVFASLISAIVAILLGWNWSSVAIMYFASGTGSFFAMLIAVAILPERDGIAEEVEDQFDALSEMKRKDGQVSATMACDRYLGPQMKSRKPCSKSGE